MKKILLTLTVFLFAVVVYCGVFVYGFMTPSRGKPVANFQNPKSALLVIDIQKDLTEPNGKASLNPDLSTKMIANVNRLIDIFSKNGTPIVYIRHEYKPNFLVELLTKSALKEGTPGAKMDPRVTIAGGKEIIKYKMDPFKKTALDDFLEKNEVNHVYLTGLDAEMCVDKTIKAACNRNLKVSVVGDGIGTTSIQKLDKKLKDYETTCAEIVSTDELIRRIQ